MESTYVVWFHSDDLGDPMYAMRVNARTFVAVENWAFQFATSPFYVRSIVKEFGTPAELDMFGRVDVDLEDADADTHSVMVRPGESFSEWRERTASVRGEE